MFSYIWGGGTELYFGSGLGGCAPWGIGLHPVFADLTPLRGWVDVPWGIGLHPMFADLYTPSGLGGCAPWGIGLHPVFADLTLLRG